MNIYIYTYVCIYIYHLRLKSIFNQQTLPLSHVIEVLSDAAKMAPWRCVFGLGDGDAHPDTEVFIPE